MLVRSPDKMFGCKSLTGHSEWTAPCWEWLSLPSLSFHVWNMLGNYGGGVWDDSSYWSLCNLLLTISPHMDSLVYEEVRPAVLMEVHSRPSLISVSDVCNTFFSSWKRLLHIPASLAATGLVIVRWRLLKQKTSGTNKLKNKTIKRETVLGRQTAWNQIKNLFQGAENRSNV